MKLYEIILREYIGEKEWTHYLAVEAKTLQSARIKAHRYAKHFWDCFECPVKKNRDGQYEFNHGEILVEVIDIRITTKEKFLTECFERALI